MDTGIISNRYAKALYAYAVEAHAEDLVYAEMGKLAQSYLDVTELRIALVNPVLSVKEKAELLSVAAGGKVSAQFLHFVQLVLKEHREKFMQFMANSYLDIYRKEKHISIGRLTTAVAASAEMENHLKAIITAHTHGNVTLETNVNAAIIGGFVLDIDTYRLDASVSTQLKDIRHQYEQKNMKIV